VVTPGYHKAPPRQVQRRRRIGRTTNRVGFSRYTFDQADKADIIIASAARPARTMRAVPSQDQRDEFEGHYDRTDGLGRPSSVRTFFVICSTSRFPT